MLCPIRRNRAEKCNLLQKSGGKIWWFPQKLNLSAAMEVIVR